MSTATKDTKMIHQAVVMPAMTYFGYRAGNMYTLVVRDNQGTRIHRSAGAPIQLIDYLEFRGYKLCKFGGN